MSPTRSPSSGLGWGPGRLKEDQPELTGGGGPAGPWNAANRVWDPGTRQESRVREAGKRVPSTWLGSSTHAGKELTRGALEAKLSLHY